MNFKSCGNTPFPLNAYIFGQMKKLKFLKKFLSLIRVSEEVTCHNFYPLVLRKKSCF